MVNQVLRFGINTSCIKVIKSMYKTKVGSKSCRIQGMTKYQEAEKEEGGESRREVSRTGIAAAEAEAEPRVVATEE